MEVLVMVSRDEIERQQYQDRLKAQRDAATAEYATKYGIANARRLALQEGQLNTWIRRSRME
jgi:hypothetical protein